VADLTDLRHPGIAGAPEHRLELIEVRDLERQLVDGGDPALRAAGNEHHLMMVVRRGGHEGELEAAGADTLIRDDETQDALVELRLGGDVARIDSAMGKLRMDFRVHDDLLSQRTRSARRADKRKVGSVGRWRD
jgi:hypothetical protein